MCYTSLIFSKSELGELGLKILLNQISENYKINNHGYALFFSNYSDIKEKIRTMDFLDFLNFIIQNREKIKKSKLIHLHLRLSTNKVKEEFIHLWEVNGWNCSHNGVLHNCNLNNIENDSLSFFMQYKDLFEKEKLRELKKVLENDINGYGLFLLSNVNKFKILAFAKSKDANITILNNIVVISSNGCDLKNSVEFEVNFKKVKIFNFKFEKKKKIIFNFSEENNIEKLQTKRDNFIFYYDLENNKYITIKLKEQKYFINYYQNNLRWYYKYNDSY